MARCAACGRWEATLTAIAALQPGDVVTVPVGLPGTAEEDDPSALLLSFDGGARLRGPGAAMGGAALLWSARFEDGRRMLLAEASAAIPWATSATEAEAWGLRVGLGLIRQAGSQAASRKLEVFGDNLAVVRFGAGTGRVRDPSVWALISAPLAQCLGVGWGVRWHAVRRRFNTAADAAASKARDEASAMASAGQTEATIRARWC